MKRFIAVILVVATLFIFTACGAQGDVENTQLLEGFNTIKMYDHETWRYPSYLIYDVETNVIYIATITYNGGVTMCPYYDENGNVAFYDGGSYDN